MTAHGFTAAEAAKRIGVTRDVLLVWERRYGFPKPPRLANGERLYPPDLVAALSIVPVRRDAGVPLTIALDEARRHLDAAPPPQRGVPAHVYRELLDRVDVAVSILTGPNFIIEAANSTHRRMYPGQQLEGRPALDALTHSFTFYDIESVLRHVATSGSTLTWHETLVPHYGEERWWNFSYSRLEVETDDPIRIALIARDMTAEIAARRELHSMVDQAAAVAAQATSTAAAFDLLARLCERISEGATESDPELLGLLLHGLRAEAVSSWIRADHTWERRVAVGGGHSLLPGHEFGASLAADNVTITAALESRQITDAHSTDLWPDDHHDMENQPLLLVPINELTPPGFILIEAARPDNAPAQRRLLRIVARLLGRNAASGASPK